MDRVDLIWAVLADIACSIYEQFQNLSDLTGNQAPAILGCGGGFQSQALCQMLADLSGRELVLRPGFEQATVQGLIQLCGETMGEPSLHADGTVIRYTPRENQLIHRYYPVWLENRNHANGVC